MIRFNFIKEFRKMAMEYDKDIPLSNEILSKMNNDMFSLISENYKKEIPYIILDYSESLKRDVIKYIPNKELNDFTFKRNGIEHKFTENLIDYVKQSEIPYSNYYLEIDAGNVSELFFKNKPKKLKKEFIIIDGLLDFKQYMNCEESESLYKIQDLDGMNFFSPNEKGLYIISTDEQGINSIIMLDIKENIYLLNYVTTANRSRGQGLSLELYKRAMNYIKDNNGILIRSEPSELGAAFIEKKITKMLESEFPNEPVLSEKTKDLNLYIRMLASGLNIQEMNSLKRCLFSLLESRKNLEKINILGEYSEYQITKEMTEIGKEIILKELEKTKKIKNKIVL